MANEGGEVVDRLMSKHSGDKYVCVHNKALLLGKLSTSECVLGFRERVHKETEAKTGSACQGKHANKRG